MTVNGASGQVPPVISAASPVVIIGEGLVIRPGDKLIIAVRGPITAEHAGTYRAAVMSWFPELADVRLVEARQMGVIRSE